MNKEQLKKLSGKQVFDRGLELMKREKLSMKQFVEICKEWLEVRGLHKNSILGWAKSEDGIIKRIGEHWAVAQQLNPEWRDEWEGKEHVKKQFGELQVIPKYIPRKMNEYLEEQKRRETGLRIEEDFLDKVTGMVG